MRARILSHTHALAHSPTYTPDHAFTVSVTNSLSVNVPDVLPLWHPSLNEKTADQYTFRSMEKVWWKCPHGPDHEWQRYVCVCACVRISVSVSVSVCLYMCMRCMRLGSYSWLCLFCYRVFVDFPSVHDAGDTCLRWKPVPSMCVENQASRKIDHLTYEVCLPQNPVFNTHGRYRFPV